MTKTGNKKGRKRTVNWINLKISINGPSYDMTNKNDLYIGIITTSNDYKVRNQCDPAKTNGKKDKTQKKKQKNKTYYLSIICQDLIPDFRMKKEEEGRQRWERERERNNLTMIYSSVIWTV